MAAQALLVQSRSQPSSSAAPATFTASYASNTTAGTLLLALVATADSGAPTITTPTSASGTWTLLQSRDQGTALSLRLYAMPNNPGGFTGVVFGTLTNINGIAVALYEFSGMRLTGTADGQQGTSTSAASGTAVGPVSGTPIYGGELWIGFLCSITGVALTPSNSPASGLGTWTAGVNPTSTVGATNVQMNDFYTLQAGPAFPTGGVYTLAATAGGSIASGALLAAFLTNNSRALGQVNDFGSSGLVTDPGTVAIGG